MQVGNQIIKNPIVRALQIIGDRSTMLIMRDVFLGRHRFKEFFENSHLSRGTLSTRLESLVANEVLCKKPYSQKPLRYEYRLTSKGKALYSWALMVWQWESDWANGKEIGLPKKLTHNRDGSHALVPICVCRNCGTQVTDKNVKIVRLESDVSPGNYKELYLSVGKQRRMNTNRTERKDNSLEHISDIIADRWSVLIIAANLLGVKRFEEYQFQLGIATNVLASRLKMLTSLGVLNRVRYQAKPPRYEYCLSDKGRAIYGQIMALRQWVLDYFPAVQTNLKLVHLDCGADLHTDVICEICDEIPNLSEVQFERKTLSLEEGDAKEAS